MGSASHRTRASQIVGTLSLDEKIRLTSGLDFWHTQPLPAAGVDPLLLTDGPHGLRKQAGDSDHLGLSDSVPATCFPTAAALGSTWDPSLLEEVGAAVGREARAEDVAVVLGPGLNLERHPLGGRNFEYLSEDPLLSGRLAAAIVRGIQSEGVGACLKHFAVNNHEANRMIVDAVVDPRTLRELYLTGFEIAVRESAPWTVMCSYNQVGGTYASDSKKLQTDILRDEWGFDGLVVSDWGATNDKPAAIRAGMDLEMPGNGGAWDGDVRGALMTGALTEEDLDTCVVRITELMLRHADAAPATPPDFDDHHALARRAAAAGTVLLTNDGTLPLGPAPSIASIGAFAQHPRYQGAGSSQVSPTRLDSILGALEGRAEVAHAAGYDHRTGETTDELISEAVELAQGSDVVVLVVGLPGSHESEGFDRTTAALPPGQDRLAAAVLDTGTPVVAVLVNGGSVVVPWSDRPAALLESYLGGQAAGSAIVDVLLGDAEPGGRLAESFADDVDSLAASANFPGSPRQVEYRETFHVGYRFHDTAGIPARFPFGHGLSYTTFEWNGPVVSGSGTDLVVSMAVTNTGRRAGSDVVQLYVRHPDPTVPRPEKELQGFSKVHLDPGATDTVTIDLDRRSFAHYDPAQGWVVEPGTYELLIGASSVDIRHTVAVDVESDDEIRALPRSEGAVATDREFEALLGRPIPRPRPPQPFHRGSSIGELRRTRLGSIVAIALIAAARRQFSDVIDEDDAAMTRMVEATIAGMPLRAIVAFSGGRVGAGFLDRLIAALNGRWGRVFARHPRH